ncbi:hypothetical protein [uncultured Thermomonospora sp.]|uniref:hypothetical protein n=1 Tax=uncultured Thermomonospora sp. TaxID=671175 RepID=UPI00259B4327|nr:hypothetical protein [uncultured Thermomonospora sp.]
METFYRWHQNDIPFTADRAWSGLWGAEFNEDGSKTMCFACDGTGAGVRDCPTCTGDWEKRWDCPTCQGEGIVDGCEDCDGEGWKPCVRGFSCEYTPEALIRYFAEYDEPPGDGRVVVFEGEETGTGFDGEPCAVPERVIEELTWGEFLDKYGKYGKEGD